MNKEIKDLRIVITGASGYIGSQLVKKLDSIGCNLAIIKRDNSDLTAIYNIKNKLNIYVYDNSTKCVIDIFEDFKPDIVIHLASLFLADHKSEQVENLISSNLLFSTQIAEAMKQTNVQFMVNTGTSWEHYNNSQYNPVCLYAATKNAFESIIEYYIQTSKMKVATLKLFDTYGCNDPRSKLIPFLRKLALNRDKIDMTDGEQLIDIVHIDDVIEAYICAIIELVDEKIIGHERFMISSGKHISLRDLVKTFEQVMKVDINVNWGTRPYRDREVMIPATKGSNLPGWKPKISLKQGFKKFLQEHDYEQ